MSKNAAVTEKRSLLHNNVVFSISNWRKNLANSSFSFFNVFSAFLLGVILFSIVFFVGKTGFAVFKDVSVTDFLFSTKWEPLADQYGVGVFILGTLYLTALTLVIVGPLSIGLAIFIAEIAPKWLKEILRPMLDILVGIPSIVYGYLGLVYLVPNISKLFDQPIGQGILAAALVLTLMVLPTITRIADDAISAVPRELREASLGMGATQMQTIFRVILPASKSGVFTGIVMGLTRAIGETMAVVMVIGNSPELAKTLTTSTSVLTSRIVNEIIDVQYGTTWNNALYMMAFILLLISLALIVTIRIIKNRGGATR